MEKEKTQEVKTKSNSKWGIGIVVLYSGFVLFMLTLVLFVTFQKIDLVSPDYYQKDLTHQSRIDATNRAEALLEKLKFAYLPKQNLLSIGFPKEHLLEDVTGQITLFRPSDASLDQIIKIAPNHSGQQQIKTQRLAKGLWKVTIEWQASGDEYFFSETVYIE